MIKEKERSGGIHGFRRASAASLTLYLNEHPVGRHQVVPDTEGDLRKTLRIPEYGTSVKVNDDGRLDPRTETICKKRKDCLFSLYTSLNRV